MPDRTKYKLLRTGNIRAATSRGMGRSARYEPNELVTVPDITAYGNAPFLPEDLRALSERLEDRRWTRGTRNIYGLEGLLTALLVLPLGLRLGTWLPLIWNEGGWKDLGALDGLEGSRGFLDLTIGFMRTLDRGFSAKPPRFVSVIDTLAARHGVLPADAPKAWAQGFSLAAGEGRNLDIAFDPAARNCLLTIAALAHSSSGSVDPAEKSGSMLRHAVLTLARVRVSRGPLGALN